jgi:serine-type D-Ala-D-Ala carboxypeptidase (penicillin-binding protein 5/6)
MKKISCSLLILAVAVSVNVPVASAANAITAPSVVLLEPGTQRILYARAPHRRQAAASTTKIVTALVALESISLDHWVKVRSETEGVEASKLYLKEGDELRVRDLLKAILMKSANDAAHALALEIAGSERGFAKRMTKKAKAIGAKNTRFINASGLPGKGQYSTAHDLALIMNEALESPVIVSILKQKSAVIRTRQGKRFFLKSHNKMLWQKQNVIGKTGWTRVSKHCFLGLIQTGEREAIVSMLGSHRLWSDVRVLANKFMRLIGAKSSKYLAKGSRGDQVAKLQWALKRAGYFPVHPTGYFGTKTKEAVFAFQRAKNLAVDGIVGPKTQKALTPFYATT